MEEENFDNIDKHNISVVKFSGDEQSQQGEQKIDKSQVDQQENENSLFFIDHQDDFNIQQQNNEVPQNQEEEIEIIQFAENRDMFFDNNKVEVDKNNHDQKGQQIIELNIPAQQFQDRHIPRVQEPQYTNPVQQLQINYSPVPDQQNLVMIPTQSFNTPIQPSDQYDNKQDQAREDGNIKIKQKKKLQKQEEENSDKHYQNNVVVVPINQNDAQQDVLVNLGSNLSTYCCLGLLNRSDSCCQWVCDLTVYCLTLPLTLFKKLIVCIWDGCLEMCCQNLCPDWSDSCKMSCGLLSFNCSRCYNSLKRNSNVICTQICCCINCSVFSQQIMAYWDSCSSFCFQMCSAFCGLLLVCCEFILNNFSDCLTQICTFCCDCLSNSCQQISQFLGPICDAFCELIGICCKCIECLK
ncbi:unnamed protein product (macronuclear) [Paramecium tetraurelia]|uniref:Transmembrane protein n=1 Tax=Paramecium tetraurelia TaxID=5888 RepID=A0EDJ2_PARTE|nr:uncharacterized protein GSPATT00025702001 [Paramecium tetraurelia]CAK93359.1 unnamed protein product [Paramecium tetraurelia]|eukprot:XP_001460756.1 hypothetical protein (macronuclear) [Paramecium tetraurelia strain d4-2]